MIPFYRPVLHGSELVCTAGAELAMLKAENARLSADLDALRERIDALERWQKAEIDLWSER